MGLDFGKVRIGVAISDDTQTIAFGKEALKNDNNIFRNLKFIAEKETVMEIVVGYPLNLKGEKTEQTIETEKFIASLKGYLNSPAGIKPAPEIIKWDERFTSAMAADSMIQSGMKKSSRREKGNIDIISAAIMLQSFLDNRKNRK